MHPRWLWLVAVLLLPACATTTQDFVPPPDKPKAAQQQDLVDCQNWATQKARDEGYGPTSNPEWSRNPTMYGMLYERARDRWFQHCMVSRGYVSTQR